MNAGKPLRAIARTDLNIRTVGDEVVVQDPVSDHTHALDAVTAAVLSRCDGTTTLEELAVSTSASGADVTVEQVHAALDELEASGLVAVTAPGDLSRRRVITRVAAAGAAGVAIPVVQSVVAPGVAAAQTGANGGPGGPGNGGTPVLETATVTATGTSTATGGGGTTWQSIAYFMNLNVVSSNTSISSGSVNFVSQNGPHDVGGPNSEVLSGSGEILWDDGSTSQATFTALYDWDGVFAGSVDLDNFVSISVTINSGRFAQTQTNSYPQSLFVTDPQPVGTSTDPELNQVTYVGQMVLGG